MTRDFAKKRPARSTAARSSKASSKTKSPTKKKSGNTRKTAKPTKKPSWWLWLAAIVGIILFVFFLKKLASSTHNTATPATIENKISTEKPAADTPAIELDFYQILKEHKVTVDAEPIPDTTENAAVIYWLQAASFKTHDEANSLRAQLLLLNLEAVIEQTTDKQQRDWYRVLVGPYQSRSKMAKARSILASIEIKSLVIKRKIGQ